MKRLFLIAFSATFALSLMAEQMPEGYYNAANGKQDAELKTALSNICKGGERVPYGSDALHSTSNPPSWEIGDWKSMATWGAFFLTDQQSDGSVWDMYGPNKRYFPIKGQSGAGLDIEHGFPKSWWGKEENNAYKDLYHLSPADMYANGNKSNYPPGFVPNADKFDNGVFRMGKNSDYGNFFVFEPADCYKGDFARAYFYIATAYEDLTWLDDYSAYITNDSYLEFQPWLCQVLLAWHRADPVSQKELNRIDAISSIQHNRNPYIDYPELVEYIWGNKQGESVNFSTLTFTGSDDYVCSPDTINPIAFTATDITENGFTAHWSNTGSESYELEVFTISESGHNDTLLNVPIVKSTDIKANPNIEWQKEDGSSTTFSTADGGGALFMSTKSEKLRFLISGLSIGEQCRLVCKASVYNKGDKEATLCVIVDDDTIAQQPLTLDEKYYEFSLPENAQNIILIQKEIGTNKAYKRVSMQQIFIIQGNYTTNEIPLEGYPVTLNTTSHQVNTPLTEDDTLYYRVTAKGMRCTNTVKVSLTKQPTTDIHPTSDLSEPAAGTTKFIRNNQLYIRLADNTIYSIFGTRVQ